MGCNLSNLGFSNQFSNVNSNMSNANLLLTSNLYSISRGQGFINCNILSQQFVNDLKVSSLNLNNGNLTNLNTINGTTGIFGSISTTNNANEAIPSTNSFGGIGDKIIIKTGTSTTYPYSIGIENKALWISGEDNINFYNRGIKSLSLSSNNSTEIFGELLCNSNLKLNQTNISNIFVASNLLSNININHGFLNTNITTEQYIKTLKCDTLNLNTGNISNINGITANELITSGKIKENNKFLDATYLTSNHLYNLAYNYTEERRYPSKASTTISPETSITLLGNLVYYEKLYLNTNSISYGSGFYEVYSSSTYGSTNQKSKLFNYITTTESGYPRWGISLYNSGTGNYQGNSTIDGSYFGDWVIIKLPQSIMLTRYKIYQRTDSTFAQKSPSEWKVYGSNDGITFTEITEASQMTRLITSNYTFGFYEKSLNPSFTTQYQWIGFVFNKLLSVSGHTELLFSELELYGKEIISNSIVSNIYATSNAVKYIVRNEMADVGKRNAFYVSIPASATYYDGISATTYYKYDLDLRLYTKTQTIANTSDLMRIYKIRFWYVPSYFGSYIYGEPYVSSYEVYMSYKANPVINRPETAGLNIYSVGFPDNTKLANILPNQLMLLRNVNSSLDYITIVSRTAPCDIYVIIEDMLY